MRREVQCAARAEDAVQEIGGRRWFPNLLPAAAESGAARGVVPVLLARHVVQRHATHICVAIGFHIRLGWRWLPPR